MAHQSKQLLLLTELRANDGWPVCVTKLASVKWDSDQLLIQHLTFFQPKIKLLPTPNSFVMADSHHVRGEKVKTHYITVQRDTQQSTGRAVNASLVSVSERGLITTHTGSFSSCTNQTPTTFQFTASTLWIQPKCTTFLIDYTRWRAPNVILILSFFKRLLTQVQYRPGPASATCSTCLTLWWPSSWRRRASILAQWLV